MSAVDLAELYLSIQGESTSAGRPCVFIRLAGCGLSCVYCDAEAAAKGSGERTEIDEIIGRVKKLRSTGLVELTGGEPLMQRGTAELLTRLVDEGFETLVETNGTVDLGLFDYRARYIVDIKTPGSGAGGSFLESNYEKLRPVDEVKFVVTSKIDFEWAARLVRERGLEGRCVVLFSPAWGMAEPKDLAEWLINSGLKARLNLQLHKYIWGPDATGV